MIKLGLADKLELGNLEACRDWFYVSVDPAFYRPDEPLQLVGSIEKIQKHLGWQPQHSFELLVELMVNYDLKQLGREGGTVC